MSAATPPRADRLRFVGQADCEAQFLMLYAVTLIGRSVDHERFGSLMRTLATDKERI